MTWSVTAGTVMPARPRPAEAHASVHDQPPARRAPGSGLERTGPRALRAGGGHPAQDRQPASGTWCECPFWPRGARASTLGMPAYPSSLRRQVLAGRWGRTLSSGDPPASTSPCTRARARSRELGSTNPGRDV